MANTAVTDGGAIQAGAIGNTAVTDGGAMQADAPVPVAFVGRVIAEVVDMEVAISVVDMTITAEDPDGN